MKSLHLILCVAFTCLSILPTSGRDLDSSLNCFKSPDTGHWLKELDPVAYFQTSPRSNDRSEMQNPWPVTASEAADGTISIKTSGKVSKKDTVPLQVDINHAVSAAQSTKRTSHVTFGYDVAQDLVANVPAHRAHIDVTETIEPTLGRSFSLVSQRTDDDYEDPMSDNRYFVTRAKNYEIDLQINGLGTQLAPCSRKNLVNPLLSEVNFELPFPASTERASSLDLKLNLGGYLLSSCGIAFRLTNLKVLYKSLGKVSEHKFHISATLGKFEGIDVLFRRILMIFDEKITIEGDILGQNLLDQYMISSRNIKLNNNMYFKVENLRFQAENKLGKITIAGNVGIKYGKTIQFYDFTSYDLTIDIENYKDQKLTANKEDSLFLDLMPHDDGFLPEEDAFANIDAHGTAHWHLVLDKSGRVKANGKIVLHDQALK